MTQDERDAREELRNIVNNAPVFPGDTIAHASANDCVARGWAARNKDGDFVPTPLGVRVNSQEAD